METLACNWDTSKFLIVSENVYGSLIYYSHLLPLVLSLFFGLFIFLNNRKSLLNRTLFFITVAFSLWVFFDLILWANEKPNLIMFFWAMLILLEPIIYASCLYFVYIFVKKKDLSFNKKAIIALLLLPVVVLISSKFALLGFDFSNCDRVAVEGPLVYYGYFSEAIFTLWILYIVVSEYKKVNREFRKQIILVTLGVLLFIAVFSWGNLVQSLTDNWIVGQYGLFGMPILIGFLSYLVVRFKAFNAKLFATQALVWALGFLLLALLFIRTLSSIRLIISITLFLVVIIGYLLIKSVKREIEQREKLEKLTDELEQANEKLKSLDKLKTEFLSLASHQLRSPLTAIKGYASMLDEGSFGKLSTEQDGAVKRIYTSAQGLVNMVEDLLNVSKIEQGGMQYEFMPTDLNKAVNEIAEEMKIPAESKGLELKIKIPKYDNFMVSADPVKIHQVFLNLIDNSIKYTASGFIEIGLTREANSVVFYVKDSGIGVTEETKAKLFTKFSRGEGARMDTGGSGLGLYLAYQIVKAHKGEIHIDSLGLGKGTTFSVILPNGFKDQSFNRPS